MKLTSFLYVLVFLTFSLTSSSFFEGDFAMSQQNLGSSSGSNVTQDMINLLSTLSGSSNRSENEIFNDTTEKISESTQQNASDLHITYTNPESMLLEGITIPEGRSIPIYDASPFLISEGHLTANLPCNDLNSPAVSILVGQIPHLRSLVLEFIPELSDTGELCTYQVSLHSNRTDPISQIIIQNNSTEEIEFPSTSTFLLGVSKLEDGNTSDGDVLKLK